MGSTKRESAQLDEGALKTEIVKEPWEMTIREYGESINADKLRESQLAAAATEHKVAVRKALSEGKSVPAEVLNDYPDLKDNFKPALTSNEANSLAYEFTKYLSPENIAYIKDRAATEGKHPSELLDNIINTSRTFYRSPVGKRHK